MTVYHMCGQHALLNTPPQVPEGMQDEEIDSDVYGEPQQLLNPESP